MKNILLCFFLLYTSISYSQNQFILSGKVQDHEGEAMLYGNVMLRSKTDEAPLKYTYIENGIFTFDPQVEGEYFLEINCLGFEKVLHPINLKEDIDLEISLKESSTVLDEVQVVAERNAISYKNGNLKMDVANTNFAAQPAMTSLLSIFPKIITNPEGTSLTVIGKGNPLIYLDNQRISMDQLNSIAVNSIQSIELINNPSAKYEAEGRAVVLIKRKKGVGDGVRITLSENASWQRHFNNYAGANGSFKKGKLELRSNVSFNKIQLWEGSESSNNIFASNRSADNEGYYLGRRPQYIVGGGFYYQLNEGDYLSGNANVRAHTSKGPLTSTSNTYEGNLIIDEVETLVNSTGERSFFTSNLNYNKKLTNSNSNLFLGLQYSKYIRDENSEVNNNFNHTIFETYQKRDQDFQINAYAGRVDFEKKIRDNLNWEIGANLAIAEATAFSEFDFFLPNTSNIISNYNYSERNTAFYTQFSGTMKTVEYAFGFRSESTNVEGGFKEEDELTIDRKKTIPFPRLMLNIPLDSSLNLTLNYTKTIARPNYLNASAITTYISPFFEYTRNVNLRSMINEEISANLQYKKYSLEFSYVRQQDPTYVSILLDEQTDRLISSPQNLEMQRSFNVALYVPINFKKWTSINFVRGSISKLEDESAVFQSVEPSLYFYSRHQIRLPKQFSFGGTFWGTTDRNVGAIENKGYTIVDLFASKSFGKNLTISLNLNDVFQNFEFTSTYNFNNILTNETRFSDRRAIAVNIRYSFGKEFKSKYQNKDVDDNLKRM